MTPVDSQSIKSFLARPAIVYTGSISTSDTVSTITKWPIVMTAMTDLRKKKLAGIYSIRGTFVYTLQINANRFQQGRYIFGWVPTGGGGSYDPDQTMWIDGHLRTLVQRSQIPHIEFTPKDTEVVIRIPFIHVNNSVLLNDVFDSNNGRGELGALVLCPYVPLAAASGSLTASISLYSHIEDVEFGGNVMPIIPQSGRLIRRKKHPSQQEQEARGMGPISGAFSNVSRAAQILGKVPLLSSVSGSLGWAADIAAGVANVFGWSKPLDIEKPMKVVRTIFDGLTQGDGTDPSQKLSVTRNNLVATLPGFAGTDLDELSFSYFKSIPSWHETLTWNTTDVSGRLIQSYDLMPLHFIVAHVSGRAHDFAPYQLMCQLHQYWRGSIGFRMKFVKTEFHSGRLLIGFNPDPYGTTNYTAPGLGDSPYMIRHIVDVRDVEEFTFLVPYISTKPWMDSRSWDDITGKLYIWVLDALVAPATVSSTLSIIVETFGGPDFEVSVPISTRFDPVFPFPVNPTLAADAIEPQSGMNDLDMDQVATVLGGAHISDTGTHPNEACIGEALHSWRTHLKRSCLISNADGGGEVGSLLRIGPYYSGARDMTNISNSVTGPDYYGLLMSMYALNRGSLRIKLIAEGGSASFYSGRLITINDEFVPLPSNTVLTPGAYPTGFWTYSGYLFNFQRLDLSGGMEVELPQYTPNISRASCMSFVNGIQDASSDPLSGAPRVGVAITVPASSPKSGIYRSGGDDLNFGAFVSIPTLYKSTFPE